MSFKIPPEFLPSKWCPNRPLMMRSDLPTLPSLPEAGQFLFWPPVLPTYLDHETGGVAPVEEVRAVLSWSQPIPAGSTTDPPRAKAERVRCLCENILRKGQKMPKGRRQTWEETPEGTRREGGDKGRNRGMRGGQRNWRCSMTKQAHPQSDSGPQRDHAGAE